MRVGGDPKRKLSPADRMIGSSALALNNGISPEYITLGAAAAVYRFINEAEGMEQSVESAEKVLKEVSELETSSTLAQMILENYHLLLHKKPLGEIRRIIAKKKAASLGNVV